MKWCLTSMCFVLVCCTEFLARLMVLVLSQRMGASGNSKPRSWSWFFSQSTCAQQLAAASCCAQVLWLKNQLRDLGLEFPEAPILCDNTSTISLAKNPVQHTRTKHIDVRHHFIRDHVQKKDVKVQFVPTQQQLADIFTKPLGVDQFTFIRGDLGMVNPNEV